jgi:hypothetical protein
MRKRQLRKNWKKHCGQRGLNWSLQGKLTSKQIRRMVFYWLPKIDKYVAKYLAYGFAPLVPSNYFGTEAYESAMARVKAENKKFKEVGWIR